MASLASSSAMLWHLYTNPMRTGTHIINMPDIMTAASFSHKPCLSAGLVTQAEPPDLILAVKLLVHVIDEPMMPCLQLYAKDAVHSMPKHAVIAIVVSRNLSPVCLT